MVINRVSRRSDSIRLKHSKSSSRGQHKLDQRKRKSVSHASPPVLVRNKASGSSVLSNKQVGKPRRRYDVSLETQGAEMRLPALPRIKVGWRLPSIVVFGFLVFILYFYWNSPTFRVDVATINGLQMITSSEVNKVLGITGREVFTLDPDLIQQEISAEFPEFLLTSVEIDIPNTVVISVTERIPALIWHYEENTFLVDTKGFAFNPREGALVGSYPIIEAGGPPPLLPGSVPITTTTELTVEDILGDLAMGELSQREALPFLSQEMVTAYLLLANQAPKGAKLIFDPVHGIGWKDRREWIVFFGNDQELSAKFTIYNTIFDHLKSADARPTLISVEYVHAPYFRLVN